MKCVHAISRIIALCAAVVVVDAPGFAVEFQPSGTSSNSTPTRLKWGTPSAPKETREHQETEQMVLRPAFDSLLSPEDSSADAAWGERVQSIVPEWFIASNNHFQGYGVERASYNEPKALPDAPSRPLRSQPRVNAPQPTARRATNEHRGGESTAPLLSAEELRGERSVVVKQRTQESAKRRAPAWQGTLIPNMDNSIDAPPYVVVDARSGKRRYVTPEANSDLERFVHRHVIVREDTGLVLSESQLDLPISELQASRQGTTPPRAIPAGYYRDAMVTPAQHPPGMPMQFHPPRVTTSNGAANGARAPRTAQVEGEVIYDGSMEMNGPMGGNYGMPEEAYGNYPPEYYGGGYPMQDPYGYGEEDNGPLGMGLMRQGGFRERFGNRDGGLLTGPEATGACTELPVIWARGEYLAWYTDQMYAPALVTTNSMGSIPALGTAGTSILYGNNGLFDDLRSGVRLRGGGRIRPRLGLELDFIMLSDEEEQFQATGFSGVPILGRPYYDILNNIEDAALISFPQTSQGTITVDTYSNFYSAGAAIRFGVCCNGAGKQSNCNTNPYDMYSSCNIDQETKGRVSKFDLIGGYRYVQLEEGIIIQENRVSVGTGPVITRSVRDAFQTKNEFHGGEVGGVWEIANDKWSIELLAKIALGNTHQSVSINGSSDLNGTPATGGLLALSSNIGSHKRDEFTMMPELGGTLGYRVTDNLRLTAGYTLIYWSRVARPGEHIDLDINEALIPGGGGAPAVPARPAFAWQDTTWWASGINGGVDYRW